MKKVKIGNKLIGDGEPVFIVAEIGINHNGNVEIAKQLIDIAVETGADAVKFQKRTVEIVYTKEELERPRESPFGKTNSDLKRGLELNENKIWKDIIRYLWWEILWEFEKTYVIPLADCHIGSKFFDEQKFWDYLWIRDTPDILLEPNLRHPTINGVRREYVCSEPFPRYGGYALRKGLCPNNLGTSRIRLDRRCKDVYVSI